MGLRSPLQKSGRAPALGQVAMVAGVPECEIISQVDFAICARCHAVRRRSRTTCLASAFAAPITASSIASVPMRSPQIRNRPLGARRRVRSAEPRLGNARLAPPRARRANRPCLAGRLWSSTHCGVNGSPLAGIIEAEIGLRLACLLSNGEPAATRLAASFSQAVKAPQNAIAPCQEGSQVRQCAK